MGLLGVIGGAVVGSVVAAAAGLLLNAPNAYCKVRDGFCSAANAYTEQEAE
jgi:gas vesicle protein